MNTPTIEEIKQQCHEAIRLGEEATKGPWKVDSSMPCVEGEEVTHSVDGPPSDFMYLECMPDASFIAHARTFSPLAAKTTLAAIDALEKVRSCYGHHTAGHQICVDELESIRTNWTL